MNGRREVNKVFPFYKKTLSKVAENRVLEQQYFHFGTTWAVFITKLEPYPLKT